MSRYIFTLALIFIASFPAFADNYCHDREAAEQWKSLVEKEPNDLALQRLHSLRLGICLKIEQGNLTLEQGITIFELERLKLIQKLAKEELEKEKKFIQ